MEKDNPNRKLKIGANDKQAMVWKKKKKYFFLEKIQLIISKLKFCIWIICWNFVYVRNHASSENFRNPPNWAKWVNRSKDANKNSFIQNLFGLGDMRKQLKIYIKISQKKN